MNREEMYAATVPPARKTVQGSTDNPFPVSPVPNSLNLDELQRSTSDEALNGPALSA